MEGADERVAGRYRVLAELGAGGMGVVYRALDEKLDREVALKMLPAEQIGDAEARARLLREARAAARLGHPGIVQVHDVGETDDGGAFVVMELVRGESLRARIGRLAHGETVRIVSAVAETLAAAHAEGLVHRDVKPDNVMVREDGRIVLLDFGLVKSLRSPLREGAVPDTPTLRDLTRSGAMVGTPAYMAPEQARGRSGPATDQWALAVVAHELLTGRLPWEGDDPTFMLAQILTDEPKRASESAKDLPRAVDAVLVRALRKDPEDRYPDVVAFARALAASVGGTVAAAEAPRRRSGVALGFAAGLVLAAASVTAAIWIGSSGGEAEPRPPPANPLLAEGSVLGCPLLEATGVAEPSGWLGAAAADLVCARVDWYLGGRELRTRVPAELLDLPTGPTDDLPEDPYAERGARDRSLAVARVRTAAFIDGAVHRDDDGFRLELRVVGAGGEIARETARAPILIDAVAEAVDALTRNGGLPRAALHPDVARWERLRTVDEALFVHDGMSLLMYDLLERRESFCRRAFRPGRLDPLVLRWLARPCEEPLPETGRIELDRTSIEGRVLASSLAVEDGTADAATVAAELGELRRTSRSAHDRALIAFHEARVFQLGGDVARSSQRARTALELRPRLHAARDLLAGSAIGTEALRPTAVSLAAWAPRIPESWRNLSRIHRAGLGSAGTTDTETACHYLDRAYVLSPAPLFGAEAARCQLARGRLEEVRAIAARLEAGPIEYRMGAAFARASAEAAEGRITAAAETLREALLRHDRLGRVVDFADYSASTFVSVGEVLGRSEEHADLVARRFMLAEPPRLSVAAGDSVALLGTEICVHASAAVRAPCVDALIDAVSAGRTGESYDATRALLDGAVAYARGDMPAAAAAWRRLPVFFGFLNLAGPFERAGAADLAARQDEIYLQRPAVARNARMADVRMARRCAAAGDHACAREHAQHVVEEWRRLDVEVPAVAEMRALLRRLPAAPE